MGVKLKMGTDEYGIPFYYDTTTSNTSFLQTASDLHKLGIKNNMFFLKIYNRDLVGKNPYDPNLSVGMMKAMLMECAMNPFYYWREVARIPEEGGAIGPGSGSPFILHRGNLAAMFCFVNSIDFYLLLPRQCYKTHSVLSIIGWTYLLGTTNSTFNFSNKLQKDADANLKKFKSHKDVLPIWLQQRYSYIESEASLGNTEAERKLFKGLDNVRLIQNPVNKNVIESKPSARTEETADGIGRGNSAPIQYYDEVEFTSFIGTIIQASGPAYVRSAETAERNNAIHCRIFTTTPGNIDSEPVESSEATRQNAAIFTEHMYDMKPDELKQYMKLHSVNDICMIEYSYRQIGMGRRYFDKMCKVLEQDKVKIKREILLQRIRGASDSPFDEDDLDTINDNKKDPIKEIILLNMYVLYIYEEIDMNQPYLVGVDCAHGLGVGADNTVCIIVDPYNLKAIACLVSSYSDATESSKMIVELITKIVPKGLLCIERNNLGSAIISILARTPVASRIYYDSTKVLEATGEDRLNKKGYLDASPENRRFWGVTTSVKSRDIMTNELLTNRVANHKDSFICRELINDLNNLIRKKTGKIEAAAGKHDDVVMAYCMCLYVYEYGSRISNWGIVKGMKPEWVKKKERAEMRYEDIYASLPEDMKAIFPAPNSSIKLNNDIPDSNNIDNETYLLIQQAQARRTKHITIDGGENVIVRDNMTSEDMINNANMENGYGNFDGDVFDICDIINQ